MQRLDWYIARTLFLWTVVVLFVLASFRIIALFVGELSSVGKGDYDVAGILVLTLLRTPSYLYEVLPISFLLGGLLGLGSLAKHRELIALKSAGVSIWRLLGALLKAGAIMMIVGLVVGEVIAPGLNQESEQLRATWLHKQSVLQTKYGVWIRDGNTFVNISDISPDGRLENLHIYAFQETGQLAYMQSASTANFENDRWQLWDVFETNLTQDGADMRRLDQTPLRVNLDADMLVKLGVDPALLTLKDLYDYIEFLKRNDQRIPEYELAFWSKLATPVIAILLLILSLPFVAGNLRNVDIAQRLVVGAIIGVVIFVINKSFGYVAIVYSVSAVLVTWLPVLVLAIATYIYLRRVA